MNHYRIALFCGLVLPIIMSGCHGYSFWLRRNQAQLPPEAFTESAPSLNDVIFVVNANTNRVQQLQTDTVSLRASGFPAVLRASLAYEQPRNFRIHAQLSQFTGRLLDIGSNQELFWFWTQREQAVYFARHSQFAQSPARNLIPIEPHQLIEALGLVYLDPAGEHQLRQIEESNLIEISSRLASPHGDQIRVLLVDRTYGWVAQQHLYDSNGQLLMSVQSSQHRFYPTEGVTMPHHIEIHLMPGQPQHLELELDVSDYAVNRLYGEPAELWTIPALEGHEQIDIANPGFRPPVPDSPYGGGANVYGAPRSAHMPAYRGYQTIVR